MREWLSEAKAVDTAVYAAVAGTETPRLDGAMRGLSRAADHSKLWFGAAAGLAVLGGPAAGAGRGAGLVSLGIASAFANLVAKPLTTRRRPEREELEVLARRHVPMPRTSSFPSGHTASAFAFATGVGQVAAVALGAAAGAGDAGRLLARAYRCPLSRRRAGRCIYRRQRRRAGGPAARAQLAARDWVWRPVRRVVARIASAIAAASAGSPGCGCRPAAARRGARPAPPRSPSTPQPSAQSPRAATRRGSGIAS